MEQPNSLENSLNAYVSALLEKENLGKMISLNPLDDGGSSSHDNFLIHTDTDKYVLRMEKESGALNHTNLGSEYTILQLLESYDVGPKSIAYDTTSGKPALLETYIEGRVASSQVFSPEHIAPCIELMDRISSSSVAENDFSFMFHYPSYEVSFPRWKERVDVVRRGAPEVAQVLDVIAGKAEALLIPKDDLLRGLPSSLIYNDVHAGNLIFETETGKAKFVDWQKVSLGDPTFMIVLFGERFASVFGMEREEFRSKVQELYEHKNSIPNFAALYAGRAYERAISDLIWTAWVKVRKGESIDLQDEVFQNLSRNVSYWEGKNSN